VKLGEAIKPGGEQSFELPYAVAKILNVTGATVGLRGIVKKEKSNTPGKCWILGAAEGEAGYSKQLNKFSDVSNIAKALVGGKAPALTVPGAPQNGVSYFSGKIPVTLSILATAKYNGRLVKALGATLTYTISWDTRKSKNFSATLTSSVSYRLPELVSAIVASLSSKVQNVLATTLNGLSEALNFLGTDVGSKLQSVGQMAADDLKVMGNTAGGVGNGFLGILEGGAGGVVGAAGALGNLLGTPGAAEAAGAGQNLATAAQQNFNAASQNFTAAGGNLQSAWGNLGGAAVTPAELALVGQIADAFNKDTYIKYVIAQVRNAISSITAADVKVGVTGKASFELADEI
jgi:hypothetical protein